MPTEARYKRVLLKGTIELIVPVPYSHRFWTFWQ
jgi:hypothetical protein